MQAAIALGSNIGDKFVHIQNAIKRLEEFCTISKKAPIFESLPVDCPPGSPSFYNTAILLETDLDPVDLLSGTKKIEAALGRPENHGLNEPRVIDLDLLFAEGHIIDSATLTIPHPRLHERSFVLKPLNYLCPNLIIPNQTLSISELLHLQADRATLKLVIETW